MPTEPVKPLVVRFGAFGDMVLLIPLLKFLRERYGRPCDIVSSGPWSEPLLQRVPAAGERFYLTSRRAPFWFNRSQWRLVSWLRRRRPGPVYVFEPDEKPLALLRRGGIGPDWICSLRDFPRLPDDHIVQHELRLASATPQALYGRPEFAVPEGPLPDARPALSDEDRRDCADWLASRALANRSVVLIQPGNKKTMKRGDRRRPSNVEYWPEANWARVIDGVCAELPDARAVICGVPRERAMAEEIASLTACRERIVIGTDELPIPRLLALQERAHSMISVNTGPAHSAAAMGCPLLMMAAPHEHRAPGYYRPVPTTAPARMLVSDHAAGAAALDSLSPETVLDAWRSLFRR